MAFYKIRETVAAFQSKPASTLDQTLAAYEQELRARVEPKPPVNSAVNIGVQLAVLIPVVILVNASLSKVFHASTEMNTVLTTLLAYAFAKLHSKVKSVLMECVPFYKLNPYFGSKLEETIAAFRQPSPASSKQQTKIAV